MKASMIAVSNEQAMEAKLEALSYKLNKLLDLNPPGGHPHNIAAEIQEQPLDNEGGVDEVAYIDNRLTRPNYSNPPYAPRDNNPYAPRDNNLYVPRDNNPYAPRSNNSFAPRNNNQYVQRGPVPRANPEQQELNLNEQILREIKQMRDENKDSRSILSSHTQAISKIETQLGQLADIVSQRETGKLPSQTETLARIPDTVQAITLRNNKSYEGPVAKTSTPKSPLAPTKENTPISIDEEMEEEDIPLSPEEIARYAPPAPFP